MTAHLASIHFTAGAQNLADTRLLSWELPVLGGSESDEHLVEWLLYGVHSLFFSSLEMLSVVPWICGRLAA